METNATIDAETPCDVDPPSVTSVIDPARDAALWARLSAPPDEEEDESAGPHEAWLPVPDGGPVQHEAYVRRGLTRLIAAARVAGVELTGPVVVSSRLDTCHYVGLVYSKATGSFRHAGIEYGFRVHDPSNAYGRCTVEIQLSESARVKVSLFVRCGKVGVSLIVEVQSYPIYTDNTYSDRTHDLGRILAGRAEDWILVRERRAHVTSASTAGEAGLALHFAYPVERPDRPEDLAAQDLEVLNPETVFDVWRQSFDEALAETLTPYALTKILPSISHRLLVGLSESRIDAVTCLTNWANRAQLTRLCVRRDRRGRGVGREFVNLCFDACAGLSWGLPQDFMTLDLKASLVPFYAKCGFVYEYPEYHNDDDEDDEISMVRPYTKHGAFASS